MNWLRRFFKRDTQPAPVETITSALREATAKDKVLTDLKAANALLRSELIKSFERDRIEQRHADFSERIGELMEARQMGGSGPWRVSPAVLQDTDRLIAFANAKLSDREGTALRESIPLSAVGATGDISLALENMEWRRESNLSWLEFSRWGIQQIILISRLYYIKNPLIQRGINVTASYVFGRGVEVVSEDDDANEVLKEFFERNKRTLGQSALLELHKRLQYDGQVFYIFFPDAVNKGNVSVRTIDATEIFEVISNPDDSDQPWFYHRKWAQRTADSQLGTGQARQAEAFYPALNWIPTPEQRGQTAINGQDIMWNTPVLMQKGGVGIGKWHFDTPKAYAALAWAKNAQRLLEADLTTRIALANIAMTVTTKGGQQALEGAKEQLGTTVGPNNSLWDRNPPPIAGSIFASGPGTTLKAFDTSGAVRNPSDVKEYRNMVGLVFEIPPTWLGDMETANLSTATTLDRPTELGMIAKQESWREVLIMIAAYVLSVSQSAPGGKLREARKGNRRVVEMARKRKANGQWVYVAEASQARPDSEIQLKCNFPAIREGDMPQNIIAISDAMTLQNKGGQIVGIDEKAGVGLLFEQLGVEDYQEILDGMYPDSGPDKYDPNRTKEPEAPPVPKAVPNPGGIPQAPGGTVPAPGQNAPVPKQQKEALTRLIQAVEKLK